MSAYELSEDWIWQGLGDCPPTSLRWAALGYRAGLFEGRRECMVDIGAAGTDAIRLARRTLAQPDWDTIRGRREIDYMPCRTKCGNCSVCIASLAYWGRGGRPFLGVAQESELARKLAAA